MVPYKGASRRWFPSWSGACAPGWATAAAPTSALRREAKFLRITSAGLKESHAHDVIITKEANYRTE
jgi:IMP dehydrogenase